MLLFIALFFFLPIAIIEEEFNFCIEYESNPKLFYKYFFFFISIKRGNWLSVNFIENTGSIVVLPRLNEPSPYRNPKSQLLDIITCDNLKLVRWVFILFFISSIWFITSLEVLLLYR